MNFFHNPVLLQEAIDFLNVQSGQRYIDATLGGGGYTEEILKRGGKVLAIDFDKEAIQNIKDNTKIDENKLILVRGNFRDVVDVAKEHGFEKVSGVVFDLGVSSYQIDQSGRGFSFKRDEFLDMRMDSENPVRAYDLVNTLSEVELYEMLVVGEEPQARTIAQRIIEHRSKKKIETTGELAAIVRSIGHRTFGIDQATLTFQALRMSVNQEMENLRQGLDGAFQILDQGGRLVVVSFHSLEDRVVKLFFKSRERGGTGRVLTKKPVVATKSETTVNRRSRSAKLRAIERL